MIAIRRFLWERSFFLLLLGFFLFIAGTAALVKVTTDYLLYNHARSAARDWAQFLAHSVTDLEQIANGEQPSAASMTFFQNARRAGYVFRYTIFNPQGYSQLISDGEKISPVDLSEYSAHAVQSVTTNEPVIHVHNGMPPELPSFYAEAFMPVQVDGRPVAVVGAYVDESHVRDFVVRVFLVSGSALSALTALSFGIPAIAWYRRTREKQQAERRIRYLAHHDPLTSLINRAFLMERLERVLAVQPSLGTLSAIHFLDVDRFKDINDMYGHDGGDFLLRTIADRLRAVTRIEDLVSRLGGDEFVVVQTGITESGQAEHFAKRLLTALTAPMQFNGQEMATTVSIGVALAPAHGNTPDRLIKSADLALYAAKAAGRNCVRLFTPDMDEALQARLQLEHILREAVAHDGFELHYQPVFEISDRKLVGFEALVRLRGPHGRLIAPSDFIPLAEEMRLVGRIGAWVVREACRTAAGWPKHLTVAVNLSPSQFDNGGVTDMVAAALSDSGIEPHRLELEITETLLLQKNGKVMDELRRLKALGIAIVMDDFGTGYSSLSYLWKFPFDKIKIDRSFMQAFGPTHRDAETVVRTIIALGRELNMRVTVEGVETARQVDFLYKADADQVQGFYFGTPVPGPQIAPEFLAADGKPEPLPKPTAG
jgi:diguanylate cyclase (GGDEF)-like protein